MKKAAIYGIAVLAGISAVVSAHAADDAPTQLVLKLMNTAYDEMQTFAARSIQPLPRGGGAVPNSGKMCTGRRAHVEELKNAARELGEAEETLKGFSTPLAEQDGLLRNVGAIKAQVKIAVEFCRNEATWDDPARSLRAEGAVRALRQLRYLSFQGMRLTAKSESERAAAPKAVETSVVEKRVTPGEGFGWDAGAGVFGLERRDSYRLPAAE